MDKKIKVLVAVSLLSSCLYAGGDVAPIVEPAPPIVDDSAFYLGLGVSGMSLRNSYSDEEFSATGIMLQAGYQYNRYIAVEGRYTKDVNNLTYDHGNDLNTANAIYDGNYPGDFSNIAIYLKPMYNWDAFSVYGLLGYGNVTLTNLPYPGTEGSVDRAESGFQWGLGVAYEFTDNIGVFADYVNMYDDKGFDLRAVDADIKADLWTLGVSYKF
jgi:opacity protein-like surface antigen